MVKIMVGFILALAIGAGCRWLSIPVPAPPTFIGALLIVAITAGYSAADRLMGGAVKGGGKSEVSELTGEHEPAAGSRQSLDR